MFPTNALLSLCLIASAVVASPMKREPKFSLSFATRLQKLDNGQTLPDIDRARAASLKATGHRKRDGTVSVTNAAISYTASVGVGEPATQYNLLIDTGSANTWIGASTTYNPTSSSMDSGNTVNVTYGSGSFSGEEYTDTVTLSEGLVIKSQSIGVASTSQGFQGVDGILGIGPFALTQGTLNKLDIVVTVTENLQSQGTISTDAVGIYFAPAASDDSSGELSFGGPDSSKTTSDVAYVPLTLTSPASHYWGIDRFVSYGSQTILGSTTGIVDTGTTLYTGAQTDSATGLLKITNDQYNKLQDLNFNIGGTNYPLTANAQIFPRSLNSQIGGDADSIYLIVADLGTESGQGLDFINGYSFLERYSVYDTTNKQFGIAKTTNTDATSS
ncbi:acid protease [Coniophora puteana RWD-64-598 SS2]|uniref:Acid protease n=1 Tax=Coniophora puteana (strain RWD-64-598) TaxID=741705 RepID=A0A5M3MDD1_CONPW|nr:acid protease [Coniophora puteana RWD-64-598 SS2]EIW77123.1 acid protease [Coniophora puteana RWD-64-598 SS2]